MGAGLHRPQSDQTGQRPGRLSPSSPEPWHLRCPSTQPGSTRHHQHHPTIPLPGQAPTGGALAVDGGLQVSNTVSLINATISGNTAGVDGGGAYIAGRPVAPAVSTLLLHNVTLTANANGGIQLVHFSSAPVLEAGNSIVGAQRAAPTAR